MTLARFLPLRPKPMTTTCPCFLRGYPSPSETFLSLAALRSRRLDVIHPDSYGAAFKTKGVIIMVMTEDERKTW